MKRRGLRDPRIWLGLAVSSLFAYLAFGEMDPEAVVGALGKADYRFLPFALVLTYGVLWVRARRWRVLLGAVLEVKTGLLFRVTLIGFLANYLLPARMGEVVRAALLGAREKISVSAALGSVVLERLLDLISILLIFSILYLLDYMPAPDSELGSILHRSALLFLVVAVFIAGTVWFLGSRTERAVWLVEKALGSMWHRMASRLASAIFSFAQGLRLPNGLKAMSWVCFWTLGLWVLSALIVILVMETFRLDLPWSTAWFVLVALGFGVSVPSAPGFVGTFHFAAMGALLFFGVDKDSALSFALVLHAICIFPVLFLGIPILWAEGMSLGLIPRLSGNEPWDPKK